MASVNIIGNNINGKDKCVIFCEINAEADYLCSSEDIFGDEFIDTRSIRQASYYKNDHCKKMWMSKQVNGYNYAKADKDFMKKKNMKGWMKDNIL